MYEIKDIAKELMVQDCMDLLNTIYSVSGKDRLVFLLASVPYMCLVTNEACEWCRKSKISLNQFKSKELLENIRAKAKLFSNDTKVPFCELQLTIENIIKIEHAYYKKFADPDSPDLLINEVGIYILNNIYIGNTVQFLYDFHLFSKPNRSIYESLNEIKAFFVEIGSMLQEMIRKFTGKPYIIPQDVDAIQLHSNKDFNYQMKFKKINNILIFCMVCRINYLLYFFKKNCPQDSMLYLRLLYITYYSLKSELQNLKIDTRNVFDSYYNRVFRNCMAHYSLYQKITGSEINPSVIGYGLTEKYFNVDYFKLVRIIENKLTLILARLEEVY